MTNAWQQNTHQPKRSKINSDKQEKRAPFRMWLQTLTNLMPKKILASETTTPSAAENRDRCNWPISTQCKTAKIFTKLHQGIASTVQTISRAIESPHTEPWQLVPGCLEMETRPTHFRPGLSLGTGWGMRPWISKKCPWMYLKTDTLESVKVHWGALRCIKVH